MEDDEWTQDINIVAGLLKLWFRELPEPLLPPHQYHAFMEAARGSPIILLGIEMNSVLPGNDNERLRHIRMHERINELPDPNYATLKHLMGHLNLYVFLFLLQECYYDTRHMIGWCGIKIGIIWTSKTLPSSSRPRSSVLPVCPVPPNPKTGPTLGLSAMWEHNRRRSKPSSNTMWTFSWKIRRMVERGPGSWFCSRTLRVL